MGAQWLTAICSLLTCFGGGTLAFLGVSEVLGLAPNTRRAASIAAALLLLAGGCMFVFSLGRPASVMAVATNAVKGSPKSLEFVCMLVCLGVAVVHVVGAFRFDPEEGGLTPKVMGVAGIVFGVLMGVAAGHSAALGRAGWADIVLPVAYLGGGLTMGGSLFGSLMMVAREDSDEFRAIGRAGFVAAAVQAIGIAALGVCSGLAVDPLLFWIGTLAVGSVVPLICLAAVPKVRALAFAALICSAAGGVCLRVVMLSLGTTSLGLIANAASHTPLLAG